MANPFTLDYYVTESEANTLLREFLLQKQISRTALTDIKYHGGKLLVNNTETTVRYSLKANDRVTVQFPPEQENLQIERQAIPLSIRYEDAFFLIVEKPAGMSTIPSREHPNDTLANGIAHHYAKTGHNSAIHCVTRLDYDTSGLVLIAKHRHIHHLFSLAQQKNDITKEYLAIIEGTLIPPKGCINQPIARTDDSIIKREIRPDGQMASTRYHTETVINKDQHTYSLLRLQLLTGRTHQIRVHMAWMGHPLLGDTLYGGDDTQIQRQALHCTRLQFAHPITGKSLQFESPLPQELQTILAK